MDKLNDQRTHIRLTTTMVDKLRAKSKETGAPVSEIIRRAIAAWLGIK